MVTADLMTRNPLTVTETTSLLAADERMKIARVRHMPVTRGRRLVGIVTHRDVLSASMSKLVAYDAKVTEELLSQVPVSEVMVDDVVTVTDGTSLEDAINLMLTRKLGCLPVVDNDGELVGIVTEADFLKLTRTLLQASRAGLE